MVGVPVGREASTHCLEVVMKHCILSSMKPLLNPQGLDACHFSPSPALKTTQKFLPAMQKALTCICAGQGLCFRTPPGTRTRNPLIKSQLLYQLS